MPCVGRQCCSQDTWYQEWKVPYKLLVREAPEALKATQVLTLLLVAHLN